MQQRPIVLAGLGEAQAGIDHQLGRVDAGGDRLIDAGQQFRADLGHHVTVVRNPVRIRGGHRPPMHQHPRHTRLRDQRGHRRVGAATGYVVDDLGAAAQRRLGDTGMHGVDADGNALGDKRFHYRQDARCLHRRVDADRAGPGGFAADVDDRRALGGQRQAMVDGTLDIQIASTVRERVIGDVHHPHDLHSRRLHFRRMRSSASDRDLASVLNSPRTAEVVVTAPGLRTPRIDMHRCSASMTTMTPRGSSLRVIASAI
ncbi:hypothetical protein C1Y40_00372 [Mycobacterium talmoniae]|uniref:Uncharacterized protein n=1 Tax=Mycobacterium talmoniae TaxID=1858794 RepID=A0A2S8BRY1_9MYCO|nr:hypothetical protein C1Y40_00372 [Mycobacterium talmoniae]